MPASLRLQGKRRSACLPLSRALGGRCRIDPLPDPGSEESRMSGQPEHRDPDELSVPEKILRVQDLWDDIARSPRDVEITPAQREEAERRLLAHESNPRGYSSWEETKRRLEGGQ